MLLNVNYVRSLGSPMFSTHPTLEGLSTAELIDLLSQKSPTIRAVYMNARSCDINPHGDQAIREYLTQLYLEVERYKDQCLKMAETSARPISINGVTLMPPQKVQG